ncbi:hypothetical protein F5882DRAFT_443727 [Hyaloscypha sp. PMI_1271]|nr:hypothetical protein F5882DRAFT_443727 [Hyaloscypha sp. PMI_1271]
MEFHGCVELCREAATCKWFTDHVTPSASSPVTTARGCALPACTLPPWRLPPMVYRSCGSGKLCTPSTTVLILKSEENIGLVWITVIHLIGSMLESVPSRPRPLGSCEESPFEDTRLFNIYRGQLPGVNSQNMECETNAMDGIVEDAFGSFGQGTPEWEKWIEFDLSYEKTFEECSPPTWHDSKKPEDRGTENTTANTGSSVRSLNDVGSKKVEDGRQLQHNSGKALMRRNIPDLGYGDE